MTEKRMMTWEYVAQYHAEYGYGPTLREIADRFGLTSMATAKKRVDALVAEGYVTRKLGKKTRLEVLMVPDHGKTLAEALREAGEEGHIRLNGESYAACGVFKMAEVLATGWEVVRG